ncbi:MAG: hypothetical protein J6D21_09465 [Clostridia bacterium]|nr:hypothetical protein [Clostridia bacterium]
MISEEKSKYKSWSGLKKQMNDVLCEALKDRITYHYTSYHRVHNSYGRATVNCDGRELVAFSWAEQYAQERDVDALYRAGKEISYQRLETEQWMPEGKLCEADFIQSVAVYLKTDVATALRSDNYLLRLFAYLDRRVGKRTLEKLKEEASSLPVWVKQFYLLRCEAEGLEAERKHI